MRWLVAALVALALPMLAGCATSLQTHKRIAIASTEALDAASAEMEQQARERYDLIVASGVDVEPRKADLAARFNAAREAWDAAKSALMLYAEQIRASEKRGENRLRLSAPGAVLKAWRALAEVGAALGVTVPDPPPALAEEGGPS